MCNCNSYIVCSDDKAGKKVYVGIAVTHFCQNILTDSLTQYLTLALVSDLFFNHKLPYILLFSFKKFIFTVICKENGKSPSESGG